ncbi:VRR-NUC domain-containing protein [Corynebacterium callunae]|uniref:VRR-NUC domain-containing protein n=2 Tax=Corynebacterium callunae TaxID=1721 RepID=M1ULD9_9CORY|nr:VRR-NUC domain-containing protein [Corynebacterium callunae]AGG66894.1 VRR-NUC domain-containing protein [Corynebacterium callunae DSM 20147]
MLEQKIEKQLFEQVRKRGGKAYKLTSPGTAGMPDRMVCLPGGHLAFIELKAPGQKPRPLQQARHKQLQQLGQRVYTIDGAHQIEKVLNEIQTT